MINDKTMILNDRAAAGIGAIMGIFKGLIIDPTSSSIAERLVVAFCLGIIGSFGGIVGKKIWIFIDKSINKHKK